MYQFRVLVNHKPIKIYHDNSGNMWVWGKPSSYFELELRNNTTNRIVGIFSVDGINVINGKRAKVKPENGYVVSMFSNEIVSGWRISNNEIRKFKFTKNMKEAYASKLGKSNNIGVFSIAIFEEKPSTMTVSWNYPDYYCYRPYTLDGVSSGETFTQSVSNLSYSSQYSQSMNSSPKVAVEAGKKEVSKSEFVSVNEPQFKEIITIYYDSY